MIFVFKIIIVYMESKSRHFGNFPGNISITRQLRHKNKNQLSVPLSTLTLTPTHLLFPFPVPLRSRPIYLALSYILRALGENTHEQGKDRKREGNRGGEGGRVGVAMSVLQILTLQSSHLSCTRFALPVRVRLRGTRERASAVGSSSGEKL